MKRIMRYLFLLVCLIGFSRQLMAQSPVRGIEYFIDSDPGIGNGQLITFSVPANDTAVSFLLQTQSLPLGLHTLFVRALDNAGKYSVVQRQAFFVSPTNPNLLGAEYFIDTDPGFGNGQQIAISTNSIDTTLSFALNTTSLSRGLHILYVRTKNTLGQYSVVQRQTFFVSPTNPNLSGAEYFIDTDPGFGNGQQIAISANSTDTSLSFNLNLASLSIGLHTLYVRTKNTLDQYSVVQRQTFFVSPTNPNLSGAEYFIDTDPGFGNGQQIAISANSTDTTLFFNLNLASLSGGLHTLYVRTKNTLGQYSVLQRQTFFVSPNNPNLSGAEYFIDTDPGFGNGQPISITPTSTDTSLFVNVNTATLSAGMHRFYVRVKNLNGQWSLLQSNPFYQYISPARAKTLEYFIDNDPGIGNGTAVVLSNGMDTAFASFTVNLNGVSLGNHKINFRAKDSLGRWGHIVDSSFCKNPGANMNVPTSICAGQPFTITNTSTDTISTTTYAWDIGNNGSIDRARKDTIQLNYPDTGLKQIKLVITTPGSCSKDSIIRTFYVNSILNLTATITASTTNACSGNNIRFIATTLNGGINPIFQWRKNGNNITGANDDTLDITTLVDKDTITCFVTSSLTSCLVNANIVSNKIGVTISPLLTPSISLSTLSDSICAGQSVLFSTNVINGGITPQYAWFRNNVQVVGQTSNTFSFSGASNNDSIYARLTSSLGCTSNSVVFSNKKRITVRTTTASTVTGSGNTFCSGASLALTATSGAGLTYQWMKDGLLMGGETSIVYNATLGGNYKAIVTNSSGCKDTSSNYLVSQNSLPAITLSLTRDTAICQGTPLNIKTDTAGLSNYTYQWLRNGIALSGANTLNYSATSGGIYRLRITHTQNGCSKMSDSLALVVNNLPVINVSGNGGQTSFCAGDTLNLVSSATSGRAPYTYNWKKDNLVTQSGNTYRIFSAGSYRSLVVDSFGCKDSSALLTFNYTNKTKANFTSPATICSGQTLVLTNTSADTTTATTYKWDIDNNGSIDRMRKDTIQFMVPDSGFRFVKLVVNTPGACSADSIVKPVYINPTRLVAITISAANTSACSNSSLLFVANVVNGGTNPTFQWQLNGIGIANSNNDSLNIVSLNDRDTITCFVSTSLTTCVVNPTASSNKIGVSITPSLTPFINITSNATSVCAGGSILFTANLTNGGSTPAIVWFKNEVMVSGQNGNTYLLTNPTMNDTIYAKLIGSGICVSTVQVSSNKIGITTKSITPANVSATSSSFCSGGFTRLFVDSFTGANYQWLNNGTAIPSIFTSNLTVNVAGDYRAILTNNNGCSDTSAAFTVSMTSSPLVLLSQTTDTSFCLGSSFKISVDTSIIGNATYRWQRDQMNTSVSLPEIMVTQSGAYRVIVTSAITGCQTITAQVNITSVMLPSVALNLTGNVSVCEGTIVNLVASNASGLNYQWYKDGLELTGASNRNYNANNAGLYQVYVTNTSTQCSTRSDSVNIIRNTKPTLSLSGVPLKSSFCLTDTISLVGSASNGRLPYNFTWINNGSPIQTGNVLPIAQTGNYRLVVTDSLGCKDSSNLFNYTFNNNPVANLNITGNLEYCKSTQTLQLAADTGAGNAYTWYKSDYDPTKLGSEPDTIAAIGVSQLNNPTWGNYYVQVTAASGCSSLSNTVTVRGFNKPTATISNSSPQTICNGQPVLFTSNAAAFGSSNVLLQNDSINFPLNLDGTASLNSSGVYKLVSYIPGIAGCADTSTTGITVTVKESPSAKIATLNATQCLTDNLFIFYPENVLQNPQTTLYTYAFGDGQTKVQPATDHTYGSAGIYTVRLIAVNQGNCTDTGTIEVKVGAQPIASFTVNKNSICEGDGDFTFTNTGTPGDSNTSVIWKMGDGELLTGNNFTHQYAKIGTYTVSITSTSIDGCSSEDSLKIEFNPKPKAKFDYNVIGSSVGFSNQSTIASGTIGYTWNLGNGETSPASSLTYNYAQAGNYDVNLLATSDKGCFDSVSKTVFVTLQPISLYLPFFPSAGGAFFTAGGYTLASTIGELTMVQTFGDSVKPIILTQGFQQPDDFFNIVNPVEEPTKVVLKKGAFSYYPNPTNGPLTIAYEFNSQGHVTSLLYDQLGRLISTIFDNEYGLGPIYQTFDMASYSDGIYYIRTVFRGEQEIVHIKKLIITH